MERTQIEELLRQSLSDGRLSRSEKDVLQQVLEDDAETKHDRNWLRSRAFAIAKESLIDADGKKAIDWLEDVTGLLILAARQTRASGTAGQIQEVHFSPGDACRLRIQELLRQSRNSADICVFTITDDRITDSIVDAAERGISVRVISDNDKAFDPGSDLRRLRDEGVPVRTDQSEFHMHHKFAVFDGRIAVSGSYNWTRSAAQHNEENIVVTSQETIVRRFQKQFDELWQQFAETA
ncbi:MAG: DUF1669 domain-containing protein [Planctomycetaceae bacterium]|nr:DUF1669 domain-containing protein [Planctomycetaceae bacterium]